MVDFRSIEKKWQKAWEKAKIFEANPDRRKKFFITIPYPYLNGNLHVGHTRTFTIGDAFARYMRMKGYNVLFPLGFHVTGTPIIGLAELIRNKDGRTIEVYTKFHDVPKDELLNLDTPEKIVSYFSKQALDALKSIGYSIDWQRIFTTTDREYQKFIEWQYWKLKELGLIVRGTHPVRYCPHDQNPVEDHDLLMGEEATIVEFTVIKFKLLDDNLIFPCATLRPETIFGVTNIWIKPTRYVIAEVDGEHWFISREAYEKLTYTEKRVRLLKEVDAKDYIGKYVIVPMVERKVPILPAEFVDTDNATGVVMSVPAHAPFDFVAIEDLKREKEILKEYGISEEILEKLKPIVLIKSDSSEIPAKDIVSELGIKSQDDTELLERATKILYKKEYHTGIMLENTEKYSNMKVSEAKEAVHADLLQSGFGDVFYEFSEKPVICRCGTKCVVKVVRDQWFLNYSNPSWKGKVLEHLDFMKIIPFYYKDEFRNKIEWLKDKACARRKGLGTRIPWDKEWLIESLSDSTIYMSYYILSKFINQGKLKAENMVKEFFDYVFLGIGDLKKVAEVSGLSETVIKEIKEEFDYWYPVDLRSSGKDLVANHLLFFIFHHIAIFPPNLWPKAIAVNGYVSLEGKKMSKSKGPLLTMKRAVSTYGADVTRLYILHAAEYDSDADWRSREVKGLATHLRRFYTLIAENYNKETLELTTLDKWLLSKLQRAIRETREAMDNLQTRRAVNAAFFEMMNNVRWYLRRGGKNLSLIIDDWLKLLAPFAPHICEELWHLKHDTFISLESYPECDETKIDVEAEVTEEYLMKLIEDINEIRKFVKEAKTVYICPADEWKLNALKVVMESNAVNEAIKKILSDGEMRKISKEVVNFVKRAFKEKKVGKLVVLDEYKILEENALFIKSETGLEVSFDSTLIPEEKRRSAMPGKPAIYIV